MLHKNPKILLLMFSPIMLAGCANEQTQTPIMSGSEVPRMRHAHSGGSVSVGPAVPVPLPGAVDNSPGTRGQFIETTAGGASPGGPNSVPTSESGADRANPPAGNPPVGNPPPANPPAANPPATQP